MSVDRGAAAESGAAERTAAERGAAERTAADLCDLAEELIDGCADAGDLDGLDRAIEHLRRALAELPEEVYPRFLLAHAYQVRWELSADPADLDAGIVAIRDLVELLGPDHERGPSAQAWLGRCLAERYVLAGDPADDQEAVVVLDGVLPRLAKVDPEDAFRVPWVLGELLFARSGGLSSWELDESTRLLEQALSLSPNAERHMILEELAGVLGCQWTRGDSRPALSRLIDCCRELCVGDRRGTHALRLGTALGDRHAVTGSPADRDEAIELLTEATGEPDPGGERDGCRLALAQLLFARGLGMPLPSSTVLSTEQAMTIVGSSNDHRPDLQAALPLATRAAGSPNLPPDDLASARIMAVTLRKLTSATPDLDVRELHGVVEEMDPSDERRAELAAHLAIADAERERTAGRIPDVEALTAAAEHLSAGHASYPGLLTQLGLGLGYRGAREGRREDLARATAYLQEALGRTGPGHPLRGLVLLGLAMALSGLLQTDPVDVPYETIITHASAAAADPACAAPAQAVWGMALLVRASVLGADDDDHEGLSRLREAAAEVPAGDPLHGILAGMIGTRLAWRADTRGDLAAMDAAEPYLLAAERAIGADLPFLPAHALRALRAANRLLRARFHGDAEDADAAIRALESDLAALSTADPWHPRIIRTLGEAWLVRGGLRGSVDDQLKGLRLVTEAYEMAPAIHPDRPRLLSGAALAQAATAGLTGDRVALDAAIRLLTSAVDGGGFLHGERVVALRHLAEALHARGHRDQAISRLEDAVTELDGDTGNQVAPRALSTLATWYRERRDSRAVPTGLAALRAHSAQVLLQSGTARAVAVARDAARTGWEVAGWCLADGDETGAVSAIEHGRALVLHAATTVAGVGALLRERGETALADDWDAALARQGERYTDAAEGADAPGQLLDMRGRWQVPGDERRRMLAVLSPMLPMPSQAGDLAGALRGSGMDVLVYVLPDSCAALLVRADGTTETVALPGLAQRRPDGLEATCEWAWTAAMAPLLGALTSGGPVHTPRLVLVPCGELATVPWHAARVRTSSGALRYAVEDATFVHAASGSQFVRAVSRTRPTWDERVVLVASQADDLAAAAFEAEEIRDLVYPGAELLAGTDAGPEAVLERWFGSPPASVLHLACHGRVVGSLSESFLSLGGEDLPVRRILDQARGSYREEGFGHDGGRGGLVVLAACTTDLTDADHDEALTLATAFLAAGASGVMGTRWKVNSDHTALMMVMFHHFLRDLGDPAEALRAAQLWMLDSDRVLPAGMDPELADVAGEAPEDIDFWAAFTYHGN